MSWRKGIMATVPVVVVGAMTVGLNLAGPADSASAAPKQRPTKTRESSTMLRTATVAPTTYTVAPGDSVSSIAGRFGVSTASMLALNGLSWKSLIFPGQVLKLSGATATPTGTAPSASPGHDAGAHYLIARGDTVSAIAARFGVSVQAVLGANGLTRASIIYPGQSLVIPAGSAGSGATLAIRTVADVTPAPATRPATPVAHGTSYTIAAGDTVSAIAARFGVTAAAILAANNMGASSLIYSGRTLVIPGAAAATTATPAMTAATGAPLTEEMAANARVIIQVGHRLGVPDRGIVIALAAAMQESGLRNLPYGDRDSVGLFQQRPSAGWGSTAQLLDPTRAAELFYGGPSNPNAGRTRGLLDIPGWQSMTVTQAAQAVQISALPNAYAPWQSDAERWLVQNR